MGPGGAGAGGFQQNVGQGVGPGAGQGRAEVSRRGAQNLLLILGGLLMAVAAIIFTVVSWGHIGLAGRAAIMGGFTAVTLAAPVVLLKRHLTATAETIGVLGLALLLLDGYAARRVGLLPDLRPEVYAALLVAVAALAAAVYARVLPLRAPALIAIVLAQVPLPLAAMHPAGDTLYAALAATAVLDALIWFALARRGTGWRAREVTTMVCLILMWGAALLFGLFSALLAEWLDYSLPRAAGLLVLAAIPLAVALVPVPLLGAKARAAAVPPAWLALTLAAGTAVHPLTEEFWVVVPFVAAGLALMLASMLLPARLRKTGAITGLVLAGVAAIPAAPGTLGLLLAPVLWDDGRAITPGPEHSHSTVVILLLFAAAFAAGSVRVRRALWPAYGLAVLAVLCAPVAFGAPRPVAMAVPLVLAVLLTFLALRAWGFALGAGLAAAEAVAWSLSVPNLVYLALGVLLACWAPLYRRPAALAGAAASGGGLVWAGLLDLGVPLVEGCVAALAVAGLLAFVAEFRRRPGDQHWHLGEIFAWTAFVPAVPALAATMEGYRTLDIPLTSAHPVLLGGLAVAGGVGVSAMRRRKTGLWAGAATLVGALLVALVPVTVRLPYGLVVGLVTAGCAGAAAVAVWLGRNPARAPGVGNRVAAAVAAGWLGTIAASAAGASDGALLTVLAVLAAVAALAAWLGPVKPLGVTLAAVLAVTEVVAVWAVIDQRTASLACAAAAVVAIGAGLAARSRAVGYLGTGFLLAASWIRLSAEGVEVVEAYTLPFALVLLGLGWWHARGRVMSSWRVYGSGLLLAFVPSVLAEPTPVRSLMLGAAALVVTVSGARMRLQAPALLGGVTLAVVAVRELSPWIADLVSVMPKWIPIAVGGLALLAIGATYEARLRDVRRLKAAVTRMT
ncbi:SCO7613 C-terminal domain-containing membrane protein [Nonomuraea sp. NPDC050328]|uniref:SCO7613 C-terminal domain-containing membrane protein n=1 Tax=Nonomuraea sp. NPDC050328 TaxID=3364361 RepID=UPI0037BC5EC9